MDYKNFTFLRQEEQIRKWYKNDLVIISSALEEANKNEFSIDSNMRKLENLLRQLYILLDEYPNALWWENAYKKAEYLVKYARKRGINPNSCYSYYNKEQYTDVDTGNIVKSNCGIRIMPSSNGKDIIIVQYDTNLNMEIMGKNELRLKHNRGGLGYLNMSFLNPSKYEILKSDALTYLRPNILIKHL